MKKSLIFLIFIFLFILICVPFFPAEITGDSVTGETITGKVSTQSLALNVSVIGAPSLTIISPENETYLKNESILLNYSAVSADMVWYNIDGTSNTTLTSPIYFSTSQGGHTLYLYANNSYGETITNITFTVNSTRFIILYSEYNGSTKGESTQFNNYTYEDIQDLNNIILENTDWGKIRFNSAINLTEDLISTDNELDLDSNTNISFNSTSLNSTALPNFNVSSTIWLYNLTFSNPRILKDGVVCGSPECVEESYTGGTLKTLKFNVTSFTNYSAEETPTAETPGGGGGGTVAKRTFSVDPEQIQVTLKEDESTQKEITLTNTGNKEINIFLETAGANSLVKIKETNFTLKAGASKTITLEINANTPPELYIERLIITSEAMIKEIPIFIIIESKDVLFDVGVNLPRKFTYVLPGEIISARIKLQNLVDDEEIKINVSYIIKDIEEKELIFQQETLTIKGKREFTKDFKLPEDSKLGKYTLYVKVDYEDKTAIGSDLFTIGKPPLINEENILYLTLIIVMILVIIIVYSMSKIGREKKKKFLPLRSNQP